MNCENRTPRVSVVISRLQCGTLHPGSVESVLSQTLSDFELIVCDDCSTDGTYQSSRSSPPGPAGQAFAK
jgi:glycosyltransferase involved in cell wall biosynthesis